MGYVESLPPPRMSALEELRRAAELRDPERCQFLLKTLFMQMEFYHALAVVVEQARAYLPTFEAAYPDGQFARQILMQMVNTGTAPARLPPEAQRDFDYPGAANYMKALADMARALQPGALPGRIGYLVSATANAIMAILVEQYYGRRSEAWIVVRSQPASPPAQQIAYQFWTDDEVALLDTDAWLQVAEAIEAHQQRNNPPRSPRRVGGKMECQDRRS